MKVIWQELNIFGSAQLNKTDTNRKLQACGYIFTQSGFSQAEFALYSRYLASNPQ
ncbi:MAG: hypothetical protein WDA68_00205 [Phycisphaerae bacterium]